MVDNSKNTMGLKNQLHGLVKQYLSYDAEGRVTSIITGPTDAIDGTPCTEVLYEYLGPGSNRIVKMKERATDAAGAKIVWDASYDIVGA